jgi:predicted DNA-binding transcriptional regulator YafY
VYLWHSFGVRAGRLISLVLLLQHRGRMSATALARELEVSTRTVLRDIDALSTAGIPVYAERGRAGGFELLDGFSTDLTGLTHNEALALLVAGRSDVAGMAPALAAAMRKVVAALPAAQRGSATSDAERILVRSDGWIRDRAPAAVDADRMALVRRAVFAGHRLRIRYEAKADQPRWRTVDPVGLVSANRRWYLLATRDGEERSYLLERMHDVEELDEPAQRPPEVDLERMWTERRARFLASLVRVVVRVGVRADRLPDLERAVRVVRVVREQDGRLVVEAEFGDDAHAAGVLWSLTPDVEVLTPEPVRALLTARAAAVAALYRPPA